MSVFSSDNTKVGTVETVDGTPDGRITAVNVTTGGFLGFGVKVVPIPEGKFALVGQIIRVEMTEDEIRRLPHRVAPIDGSSVREVGPTPPRSAGEQRGRGDPF